MAPNIGETQKNRRNKNIVRTAAQIAGAGTLALTIAFGGPIIKNALEGNQQKTPLTQSSDQADSLKTSQKSSRVHGGEKIPAPSSVKTASLTAIDSGKRNGQDRSSSRQYDNVQQVSYVTRGASKSVYRGPAGQTMNADAHVYMMGQTTNISEKKGNKNTENDSQEASRLVKLLAQFNPGEAKMLGEALTLARSGRTSNLTVPDIERQLMDTLGTSLTAIMEKASIQDLQKIANFDFQGVKIPGLANIKNLSTEQVNLLKAKTAEISEIVNAGFSQQELLSYLPNVNVNFLPSLLIGLEGALILGVISKQVISQLGEIKKFVKGHKRAVGATLVGATLLVTLACVVGTAILPTAVSPTQGGSPTAEVGGGVPTTISPATESPTINITPVASGVPQNASEIQGVNYVNDKTLGIDANAFAANNPGYQLIYPKTAQALPLREYSDPGTNAVIATRISDDAMIAMFNLQLGKDGMYHGSWNGNAINLDKELKAIVDQNGKELFPLMSPNGWGFAMLAAKDGVLYFGTTDGNYKIASALYPILGKNVNALNSLHDFVKQLDRSHILKDDMISQIASFDFSGRTLVLYDSKGQALANIDYLKSQGVFTIGAPELKVSIDGGSYTQVGFLAYGDNPNKPLYTSDITGHWIKLPSDLLPVKADTADSLNARLIGSDSAHPAYALSPDGTSIVGVEGLKIDLKNSLATFSYDGKTYENVGTIDIHVVDKDVNGQSMKPTLLVSGYAWNAETHKFEVYNPGFVMEGTPKEVLPWFNQQDISNGNWLRWHQRATANVDWTALFAGAVKVDSWSLKQNLLNTYDYNKDGVVDVTHNAKIIFESSQINQADRDRNGIKKAQYPFRAGLSLGYLVDAGCVIVSEDVLNGDGSRVSLSTIIDDVIWQHRNESTFTRLAFAAGVNWNPTLAKETMFGDVFNNPESWIFSITDRSYPDETMSVMFGTKDIALLKDPQGIDRRNASITGNVISPEGSLVFWGAIVDVNPHN